MKNKHVQFFSFSYLSKFSVAIYHVFLTFAITKKIFCSLLYFGFILFQDIDEVLKVGRKKENKTKLTTFHLKQSPYS